MSTRPPNAVLELATRCCCGRGPHRAFAHRPRAAHSHSWFPSKGGRDFQQCPVLVRPASYLLTCLTALKSLEGPVGGTQDAPATPHGGHGQQKEQKRTRHSCAHRSTQRSKISTPSMRTAWSTDTGRGAQDVVSDVLGSLPSGTGVPQLAGQAGVAGGSRGLSLGKACRRHPKALRSRGKFGSLNFHHFLFFRKNFHNYNVLSS